MKEGELGALIRASRWLFYRFAYRRLLRLLHRFHWHHMVVLNPDGDVLLWCRWCGITSRPTVTAHTLPLVKR